QGRVAVGAERIRGEPQPLVELLRGEGDKGLERLAGRRLDGCDGHVEFLRGRSDSKLARKDNAAGRVAFEGTRPCRSGQSCVHFRAAASTQAPREEPECIGWSACSVREESGCSGCCC